MKQIISFKILVFLAIALTLPSAFALTVEVEPIVDRIPPQGIASFNLTFDNPSATTKTVSLSLSPSQASGWITSPSSVTVPGESTRTVTLTAVARSQVATNQYNLLFSLSSTNFQKDLAIPVRVVSVDSVFGFQPHLTLSINAPREVDPRETLLITLNMRNQNPRNLQGVQVSVESELFSRNFTLDIDPNGELSRELQFTLDPSQTAGNYRLRARAYYPITDTLLSDQEASFEIISFSQITPTYTTERSWFKVTDTIFIENVGNIERSKEIALRSPLYQRLFLSSSLDYENTRVDGKRNIMWTPSLEPLENKTIVVTKNYRPLVMLIILLILAVVAYFKIRSPLLIEKHAFVSSQDSDGVSDIKIRLYIKNRSAKTLHNVNIHDVLPRITEFVPSASLGTIKPSKVTKTSKKGTLLNWNFDSLESYEERIVTYKIKSSLQIVGDLSLPLATAKFENVEGNQRKTTSSNPKFVSKQ